MLQDPSLAGPGHLGQCDIRDASSSTNHQSSPLIVSPTALVALTTCVNQVATLDGVICSTKPEYEDCKVKLAVSVGTCSSNEFAVS